MTRQGVVVILDRAFQSTHPYRVWPDLTLDYGEHTLFQSTHPYRVWRCSMQRHSMLRSFNPHTHTGCDCATSVIIPVQLVSIHTPIQGVTFMVKDSMYKQAVSIHTPIQGVTAVSRGYLMSAEVSIHTPIQGVTKLKEIEAKREEFQSTHPYRVWRMPTDYYYQQLMFQSTHPYRVWLNQ